MTSLLALTSVLAAMGQGLLGIGDTPVSVEVLSIHEARYVDLMPKGKDKDESGFSFSSFGMDNENALTVTVELSGPSLSAATHFGKVSVSAATDDQGKKLSLHENFKAGLSDLRSEFAQLDRDMMYFGYQDKPTDRIKVELKLNPPARAAKKIIALSGTIMVRAGEPQDIIIDRITSKMGKQLNHAALSRAGLTVTVIDPKKASGFFSTGEAGKSITLQVAGESESLLELNLIDAAGENLNAGTMWSSAGSTTQYTLMVDETLPASAKLQLRVSVNNREIVVPFAFKDLILP